MRLRSLFRIRIDREFSVGGFIFCLASAGVLLVLLVPIYQTAKDKATQRSTLVDITIWGRAIAFYVADHGTTPPNPRGKISYKKPILKELMPYLPFIHFNDWWGNPYWIWTGQGNKSYGILTSEPRDFILASLGKRGNQEYWRYDPGHPEAGFFTPRQSEDFEKDIVIWNNRLIRAPKKKP